MSKNISNINDFMFLRGVAINKCRFLPRALWLMIKINLSWAKHLINYFDYYSLTYVCYWHDNTHMSGQYVVAVPWLRSYRQSDVTSSGFRPVFLSVKAFTFVNVFTTSWASELFMGAKNSRRTRNRRMKGERDGEQGGNKVSSWKWETEPEETSFEISSSYF